MRKILLFLGILLFAASASAAPFVVSFKADTASANVVKLVKIGAAFAAAEPDAFIMTWNATRQLYETTSLDDATFVNGYYQIYDGAGAIVVDTLSINSAVIASSQIAPLFVRNDSDAVKRGNLRLRTDPSYTDNVQLRIDNNSTNLEIYAEDTAATTGRTMLLRGSAVQLSAQGSAAAIPLTGIAWNSGATAAVPKSSLDSTRGAGWTSGLTLVSLDSRLDNLEGTGTFSADDSLFLAGGGGRGVMDVNWSFDPAAVNDSIAFVQVYYGTQPVAGYAQSGAAALSSATLTQIRASMSVLHPPRGARSVSIPTLSNYYVIVVAFDHTAPTRQAWGSNQVLISGASNPLDSSVPIVGNAGSIEAAITALANKQASFEAGVGAGAVIMPLFVHHNAAQASSVTLSDFYNVASAPSQNIIVSYYKSSLFDGLRLSGRARHSAVGEKCYPAIHCDALSAQATIISTTSVDFVLELDCSTLADGWYSAIMKITDSNNATSDTAYVYDATIVAFNR